MWSSWVQAFVILGLFAQASISTPVKCQDGKAQMSHKAGESSSNNGYSNFMQHSYSYNSQRGLGSDNQVSTGPNNAQVLSEQEFNRQLEQIRADFKSFFDQKSFNFDNLFKGGMLKDQLQNICDQAGVSDSVLQEAQQQQMRVRRSPNSSQLEKILSTQIGLVEESFKEMKNLDCAQVNRRAERLGKSLYLQTLDKKVDKLNEKLKDFKNSVSDTLKTRIDRDIDDLNDSTNKIKQCLKI